MPRISRKSLESTYFHVIVQGIEKKYIFQDYKMKEKYKKLLIINLGKYKIKLLAYCIMDNHAHMLIFSEKIDELSRYMKSINTSFALYYNRANARVGYAFRSRFLSEPIKSLAQLYRTLSYIHLNPVNAGICKYPELYFFSSYNDFLNCRGIVGKEELSLLKFDVNNYKKNFEFMHYMHIEGTEFEKNKTKIDKSSIIREYIRDNNITDIIFESDKVKKMVKELKKDKISLSQIAKCLDVSYMKLKNIISE